MSKGNQGNRWYSFVPLTNKPYFIGGIWYRVQYVFNLVTKQCTRTVFKPGKVTVQISYSY